MYLFIYSEMARRGLQLDGLDFSLKALLSALGF